MRVGGCWWCALGVVLLFFVFVLLCFISSFGVFRSDLLYSLFACWIILERLLHSLEGNTAFCRSGVFRFASAFHTVMVLPGEVLFSTFNDTVS